MNYWAIAFPKPVSGKKKPKNLNKIWKRTRERISLHGSEWTIHDKVWDTRLHNCEICWTFISDDNKAPHCFAHRLWKGMYKKYRYMEENIALVCSIWCHYKLDELYQGKTLEHISLRNNLKLQLDYLLDYENN